MRMCSTDKMAACSGSGLQILKICRLHIQQGLFTGMSNLKMIAKDLNVIRVEMTIFLFSFITYTIFVSSKILPFAESLCMLTGTIADSQCKD